MRIHATIDERTANRPFEQRRKSRNGITVIDRDLPAWSTSLLGHRRRETTAIYAHLNDGALRDTPAQAIAVIAHAMGYRAEPPPLPDETERRDTATVMPAFKAERTAAPERAWTSSWVRTEDAELSEGTEAEGSAEASPAKPKLEWL